MPDEQQTPPTTSPEVPVTPTENAPVVGADQPVVGSQLQKANNSKKKKRMLFGLIAAAVVVLAGGGAGAYFGIIAPVKPENLWKKALTNTADGYDKLVQDAQKNKDIKGYKMKGDFKVTAPIAADGSLDLKAYDKDADVKIDAGAAGQRFTLEMLAHVPDNSKNPDLYAKITGLKGIDKLLGGEAAGIGSQLASLDNQWVVIDHTLLDQLETQAGSAAANNPQLTKDDVRAIEEAFGRVNRQYLFSDDSSKAVFKVTQNVGKDKVDNRSTYHYKVGYDKDHLKSYIGALKDELNKTKLKDLSGGKGINEVLTPMADGLDGKGTADVWVDTKTKLFRKVQFTDEKNNKNHLDLTFKYNGGDDLPFGVNFYGNDDTGQGNVGLIMTVNPKKSTIDYSFNADVKDKDGKATVAATGHAFLEPNNEKIDFKKPDNAKSLLDLLGGFSSLLGGGSASSQSGLSQQCVQAYQAFAASGGTTALPAECQQ